MISQMILSIALLISCSIVTLAELGIDKPVLSTINRYSPVYQHNSRPVPFLFESNFTLTSESGLFTSLVVCVFTITNLETLYVDSIRPLIQSPVTINRGDSICRQLKFNPSIDNTTLLGLFSAFRYSENTETLSNLNSRIMSVSVHSENYASDPLLFNITYPAISNSPVSIQASPVVYYERIALSIISGNILSTRMSDVISVQRQFVLDNNPITSLIINSSTIHIPAFNIWNNFMCTSNSFTHPVTKFQYCSEQKLFNGLDLNSFFIQKFDLTVSEITVENEMLKIYRADNEESYGFVNIGQSVTQNPEANHFSIWFKNKPGNSLVGCPLEVHNGDFVDYEICLTGSESAINFIYTGLAPDYHHVTVSYPTEGEFRVNDWNFVSVSVRMNSISFLLNGKVLVPSQFSWRDGQGNINTTEIPVHLYSSSSNSVTSVYILGRVSGFIGEVTGVIVDQFYISPGEAHCMFSCVEGFYMNETILNDLVQSGLEIEFVRESIGVTGTISLTQVNYILENLYHYTPTLSSNTYRLVTVNASDANSVVISTTRISHECSSNLCFNNSYCFVSNMTDTCDCIPGFFDISDNGNNSVCKHPMDCSYLNGGCSSLETCIQFSENIRECVDACRYSPCLNNGVCTPLTLAEYNCTCDTGFYGAGCECKNNCLTQGCSVGECVPFCNGTFRCIDIPTISTITTMLFSTAGSTMLSSLTTSFQVPITSETSTPFMFSTSVTELPAQTQITSDLSPSVAFTPTATTSSVHIPAISEPSVLFSTTVTSSVLMPVSPEIPFVPITSTSFIAPSSSVSAASPVIISAIQTPVTSEVPPSSVAASPLSTSVQISSTSPIAATPAFTSPIPGISEVSTSVGITRLISTTLTSSSLSAASVDESIVSQTRLETQSTSSLLATFPSSLSTVSSGSQLLIPLTSSLPAAETTLITSSLLFPPVSPSPQAQTTTSIPTTGSISSPPMISSPNLLQTQTTTNILLPSVTSVISAPLLTSSLSGLDDTSSVPPPLSSSISILPSSSFIQSPISTSQIVPAFTSTIVDPPVSITETSIPIPAIDMTSSFVMTSSSTVEIMISSTLDSLSSSDVLTSSTPLTSSFTSTPPLQPSTTSQVAQVTTSQVEQVTTSQVEQVTTSQVEQVTTSQVEQVTTSQVEQVTTSQVEQVTTSQVEQVTTSQVEQVATSSMAIVDMSSSVLDETTSSTEPIQSTATTLFITESSVASAVPSSSISDLLLPSPATSTFSTPSQSTPVTTVVTPTSAITMPPPSPPTTPGPTIGVTESSGSIGIAIGVAFGILLVVIVIIVAIAIIVALFYFRRSFVREHDPMKDFDDSEPISPAKITAVYKNEARSLI